MGATARASTGVKIMGNSVKVPLQTLRKNIQKMKLDPDSEETHLDMSLYKLHISVDYNRLMTQRDLPVGLFSAEKAGHTNMEGY